MSNSDREAQEQRNNPVGQRPQDIRSRTDVIMERDAHHLDNQQGESASVQGLSPEPDETMRTGKEERMEKGASPTLDADGKPYGHDEDPDSTERWSQAGERGEASWDCRGDGESDSSAPEGRTPEERGRSA